MLPSLATKATATLLFLQWLSLSPTTADVIQLATSEFHQLATSNHFDLIIDVRAQEEWDRVGHIENATLIDSLQDQLALSSNMQETLQELNLWNCRSCRIAVYDQSGGRTAVALDLLLEAGFQGDLYNGLGVNQWQGEGYELVFSESNQNPPCMSAAASVVSRQSMTASSICHSHFNESTTFSAPDQFSESSTTVSNAVGRTNPKDDLSTAKALFLTQMQANNANGYSYLLTISCFCPPAGYPWLVTADVVTMPTGTSILGDTILSAITTDGNDLVKSRDNFLPIYSILDLFDKIQDAVDQEADRIHVDYDPTWGYPQEIAIDYSFMVVDEEFYASASSFALVDTSIEGRMKSQIEATFGNGYFADPNSVQSMALDWLLHEDPYQIDPNADNLIQRFVMVYFYMHTSQDGPWLSCNPPVANEPDFCYFQFLVNAYSTPMQFTEIYWTRWLTGLHECDWAGVLCDPDSEKVIHMGLDAHGLTGTFPSELFKLLHLADFSLTHNRLTGPLPRELYQWTKLTGVEVQHNEFSGLIPLEWSEARTLTQINIGSNRLRGTVPTEIGLLSALEWLFIRDNHFSGSLPGELFDLTSLKLIYVGNNIFTSSIPTELGQLQNLQYLHLEENPITGNIPSEVGLLTHMRELGLQHTGVSGTIPEELFTGSFMNLTSLDLTSCQMSGTISTNIGLLQTCDFFLIGNNNFHGTIPTEAGLMRNLRLFFVDGNNLTGTMPRDLCLLRGEAGLRHVKADCAATAGTGVPPVLCPYRCCTECCNQDNGICLPA